MTTSIELEQLIAAPIDHCWRHLSDLASHTQWMKDALSIVFTSTETKGLGVTMSCKTRIGPFTTMDKMVVDTWDEGRALGVTHEGVVTGSGLFTLQASGDHTKLIWSERLRFPWLLGGPLGERIAKPIMSTMWKANLQRFAHIVEGT